MFLFDRFGFQGLSFHITEQIVDSSLLHCVLYSRLEFETKIEATNERDLHLTWT